MEVESSSEVEQNHYSDGKEECKMIITVDKSKLIPEDIADKQITSNIDTNKNEMQLELYKDDKNYQQNQLPPPTLQNLVATANLNCKKLDLRKIAQWCRNAEYNPSRFSAVIMRIRNPKTTALIFSTGKIVITGAKSENDIMQAARIFEKTVQKVIVGDAEERINENLSNLDKGATDNAIVPSVKLSDLQIQNIVASTDVGFSIKLEKLKEEQKEIARCHYEPELFPGLIYKIEDPKVVLLIFTSGKIVLAGAKSRFDIYKAYKKIHPVL